MKQVLCTIALLLLMSTQVCAANEQQPENIAGKMAVKFGRGVTNLATSVVEIPKQTVLMGRDMGAVGYLVGPFSGIIMTGYRAVIGVAETVFFLVPAPGYYDEMIDPEFVWVGWGPKKEQSAVSEAPEQQP